MSTSKQDGGSVWKGGLGGIVPARFAVSEEVRKDFLKDRFNFWTTLFTLLFVFAEVFLVILYWGHLPPEIPIFYSKPWGVPMLGRTIFIWILPVLAFVCLVVNFVLVLVGIKESKFLTRVLVVGSLLVGFGTFYGLLRIITLVS